MGQGAVFPYFVAVAAGSREFMTPTTLRKAVPGGELIAVENDESPTGAATSGAGDSGGATLRARFSDRRRNTGIDGGDSSSSIAEPTNVHPRCANQGTRMESENDICTAGTNAVFTFGALK